jgi:hypothetical protein
VVVVATGKRAFRSSSSRDPEVRIGSPFLHKESFNHGEWYGISDSRIAACSV